MIPNPIRKVLSTIQKHRLQALLMGGQACVFYGAAEFSRDTDFVLLADPENLERLHQVLADLAAVSIAVPPFDPVYLHKGHALHFRCQHPEAKGLRLDLMSVMRGVAPFAELWERRTTLTEADGQNYELISLPDLVQAKKTQRDKDWPMIRRLVEASFQANREKPTPEQIEFWLKELRTPELLFQVVRAYPTIAERVSEGRKLLTLVIGNQPQELEVALKGEEEQERQVDRLYWLPLRKELETLRSSIRQAKN